MLSQSFRLVKYFFSRLEFVAQGSRVAEFGTHFGSHDRHLSAFPRPSPSRANFPPKNLRFSATHLLRVVLAEMGI